MADLALNIDETLHSDDELRRSSDCVISDVSIAQTDITQAQFAELLRAGAPVGYEPFRHYIGGEYEYKDAVYKAVLRTSSGSSPRMTTLGVEIDVPDVYDRGSASIPAAKTTITCGRAFYEVSEVIASLKGGTVIAMPRVSNIQINSLVATFDVELVSPSGALVAGEVTWAAKGY